MGFFTAAQKASFKAPTPSVAQCASCGLYRQCKSPKMPVSGKGRRGVLVIGEAPGANEDDEGKPFVGKAGQTLRKTLRRFGCDLERDCWVTNSLVCRPPKNKIANPKWIDYCRPNVINTIKELEPTVIILLGLVPVHSLIGYLWKEKLGSMSRWAGWRIPDKKFNAWICPTFHPSYINRVEGVSPVPEMMFSRHLKRALKLKYHPWAGEDLGPPKIETIIDPDRAAQALGELFISPRTELVAFDYETNMLKPDHPDARIVSCAVSDGERTIAYPWLRQTKAATANVLFNADIGKIASNMKFEERWTLKEFGRPVESWAWDTMLAAHYLDNRRNITSIKFQAFVLLGESIWNQAVEPYLDSEHGYQPNRIHEVELPTLLKYNGLDALYEFQAAHIQHEEVK